MNRKPRTPGAGGAAAQSARQSRAPAPVQPQLPFAPLDLISADELESIHQAALTVLNEIGIDFLHDGARALLKEAGADVDPASKRVRFDPALVEAQIGLAPKEFTLHARNPARNLAIGGRHVAFGSVASAPNSSIAPAAAGPATIATIATSSVSVRHSIKFISGAAIRSSRSTYTPPSAISTRCSTC